MSSEVAKSDVAAGPSADMEYLLHVKRGRRYYYERIYIQDKNSISYVKNHKLLSTEVL